MTPEQMRALAEHLSQMAESRAMDFDEPHVAMTLSGSAAALRSAADQLKAAPHTPFCVTTSTPENPCRCWKSGSTDEEG
ncbi:hypothetical protein HUN59_05335 [Curtobacterium sp. Csp2]|uniref:hypothetical protein n=1 Tax=Curtobacterium sp. Csp2 TaxID=2495430 RepID=UPI001580B0B6|nr:hypothetical protein [Curtobacterium sp. Csp2]QKS15720.1 hypothetical protein HUN59_05335 [Curtobacterium sp. Csp2]